MGALQLLWNAGFVHALPYEQKDIFPTTGAAGAIAHAIRAVTKPGDEVLTFAPYFPEYGPYVEGTGAVLKVVPPQACLLYTSRCV